jgi:large subunit ribosomal protein L10
MDKEQKAALVDEIAERLGDASSIFAVDYRGISVPQAAELRTRLAEADATFRIVKNRLAKRAAEKSGTAVPEELLEGPTALTFVNGDPVTAAKAIFTFSRQNDVLAYKGGLMDGVPLEPEQFTQIARLPGLDVLHGQLVGVTASPLTGLMRGLTSMLSGLAVGLGQIAEKGLVGGDEEEPAAEAPEAAAEEPQAEEERTQVPVEEAEDPQEQEDGSPEQEIAEEASTGEDDSGEAEDTETQAEDTETDDDSEEEN